MNKTKEKKHKTIYSRIINKILSISLFYLIYIALLVLLYLMVPEAFLFIYSDINLHVAYAVPVILLTFVVVTSFFSLIIAVYNILNTHIQNERKKLHKKSYKFFKDHPLLQDPNHKMSYEEHKKAISMKGFEGWVFVLIMGHTITFLVLILNILVFMLQLGDALAGATESGVLVFDLPLEFIYFGITFYIIYYFVIYSEIIKTKLPKKIQNIFPSNFTNQKVITELVNNYEKKYLKNEDEDVSHA